MSTAALTTHAAEEHLTCLLDSYAGMASGDPDRPALQRQIVDAVTMTLAECESEARIAADVARSASNRKQAFERRAEAIEKAVQDAMEFAGEKELAGATFTLKLQKRPASVIITNLADLPAEFITITTTKTPDKVRIKKALQAGQAVAGADLSEGNMRLEWR